MLNFNSYSAKAVSNLATMSAGVSSPFTINSNINGLPLLIKSIAHSDECLVVLTLICTTTGTLTSPSRIPNSAADGTVISNPPTLEGINLCAVAFIICVLSKVPKPSIVIFSPVPSIVTGYLAVLFTIASLFPKLNIIVYCIKLINLLFA